MTSTKVAEHLDALNAYGFVVIPDSSRLTLDLIASEIGSGTSYWHQISARDQDCSSRRSLSGTYGFNAFPWHSDGAISPEPPRYVIMHCGEEEFSEPTEVLSLHHESSALLVRSMARTVLVIEHPRQGRRYASALQRTTSRVVARWDTRVCRPVDSPPARDALRRLEVADATGAVEWQPGTGAVIDNFAALHRRPPISSGFRVLNRKYVFE